MKFILELPKFVRKKSSISELIIHENDVLLY